MIGLNLKRRKPTKGGKLLQLEKTEKGSLQKIVLPAQNTEIEAIDVSEKGETDH